MTRIGFRILGALEIEQEGHAVALRGARTRSILAALLMDADRVVPVNRLIDAVWDDDPPGNAEKAVRNGVSTLRGWLGVRGGGTLVETDPSGYRLRLAGADLDADRFRHQLAQARRMTAIGQAPQAVAALRGGLALWRGPAFAGFTSRVLIAGAVRMEEQRLAALEQCLDLELALGRHRELISELKDLVGDRPLREAMVERLMLALHRSGRRAEALEVYDRFRTRLAAELGLDPAGELARLHRMILRADPAAEAGAGAAWARRAGFSGNAFAGGLYGGGLFGGGAFSDPTTSVAPAQLPSPVSDFTARDAELDVLDRLLGGGGAAGAGSVPDAVSGSGSGSGPGSGSAPGSASESGSAPATATGSGARTVGRRSVDHGSTAPAIPVVTVVTGPAGVGKTGLALHWAHRRHEWFPDGQLYADLSPRDGPPPRPEEILIRFLRSLGIQPERAPAGDHASLFRSLLDVRKVLILLDGATSAEQIRPLLPGGAACRVLVTSRDELRGLTAVDGARRLDVPRLTSAESLRLLSRLLGPSRVSAEPRAAAALVESCAGLPLALRIAAARLDGPRYRTLADLVADLRDPQHLDVLSLTDDEAASVRYAFAASYRQLPPPAREAFRLAGLFPAGFRFSAADAAALLDQPCREVEALLERLATVHLVDRFPPDRFGLHPLLRAYACEQTHAEDTGERREKALARFGEWRRRVGGGVRGLLLASGGGEA